jgi:hypothetical protein
LPREREGKKTEKASKARQVAVDSFVLGAFEVTRQQKQTKFSILQRKQFSLTLIAINCFAF